MVQEVYLCFKQFFKQIHSFQEINQCSDDLIHDFLSYCMSSILDASYHTQGCYKCQYSDLKYVLSYERSYIIFLDGIVKTYNLKIPVYYCASCCHYHALLPAMLIIPYEPFSLAFILSVLNDRFTNKMHVQDILDKYSIPQTTYYRWVHRYKKYYRIFLTLHNQKAYSFFVMAEEQFFELSQSIFYVSGSALFESDFKLFTNSS